MRVGGRTFRVGPGLAVFLALSVASALVIIFLTADPGTWTGLARMRPEFIALACGLMVTQWCLNGLRFKILVDALGDGVSIVTSLKAFMTNIFLGAVTPSQTGGGPMQIYVLSRAGVPVSKAFAACLTGAVLTVVCLVSSALAVLVSSPGLRSDFGPRMTGVLLAAVVVFGVLVVVFVLSLTRTPALKRVAGRALLAAMRGLGIEKRIGFTKRFLGGIDRYRASMAMFAGSKKSSVLGALLVTAVAIGVNALIAPVLLSGLDIDYDLSTIYPAQFILFFIAYFGPTPSAGGIAEFSNYWILTTLGIRPNMLGVYTLLWRFFTIFAGVTVGGFIVLSLIPRRGRPCEKPRAS